MRLPRNPNQYQAGKTYKSIPKVSPEDLQKVIWHVLHGKYRTLFIRPLPTFIERTIKLPDGAVFELHLFWVFENEKFRKQCTVEYPYIEDNIDKTLRTLYNEEL